MCRKPACAVTCGAAVQIMDVPGAPLFAPISGVTMSHDGSFFCYTAFSDPKRKGNTMKHLLGGYFPVRSPKSMHDYFDKFQPTSLNAHISPDLHGAHARGTCAAKSRSCADAYHARTSIHRFNHRPRTVLGCLV